MCITRDIYLLHISRDITSSNTKLPSGAHICAWCTNKVFKCILRSQEYVTTTEQRIYSCTNPHTSSTELSGELVGCMDRIYLSTSVQTWNYTRSLAVRRKCAWHPGVLFFLATYRDKLHLLLSERDVPSRRTSIETRTLVDWKVQCCGITSGKSYEDIAREPWYDFAITFLYQFPLKSIASWLYLAKDTYFVLTFRRIYIFLIIQFSWDNFQLFYFNYCSYTVQ